MITVSLSLALCTVIFRRFLDSYTGRLPIVIPSSNCNVTSTMLILSGALYYVYSHLKKGTLVRVGAKGPLSKLSGSQNCIQRRRSRKFGWFFRNAGSCRSKCTDAIYKVARQSLESFVGNQREFEQSIPEVNSSREIVNTPETSCDVLYNNEVFNVDSVSLEPPKTNKSVQNIMSTEQIKKKKQARRITFKLDEHVEPKKLSRGSTKPRKKLVCGHLTQHVGSKSNLRTRGSKLDNRIVYNLRDLLTTLLKRNGGYYC